MSKTLSNQDTPKSRDLFAEKLGEALQDAWNDWCADTGCVPDCVEIHGPSTTRVSMDFRGSALVRNAVEIFRANDEMRDR